MAERYSSRKSLSRLSSAHSREIDEFPKQTCREGSLMFRTGSACVLALVLAYSAHADSLAVEFDVARPISTYNAYVSVSPPEGSLSLTLNPDGTIAADLTANDAIVGFGFNRTAVAPQVPGGATLLSEFSHLAPTSCSWDNFFGGYDSGFFVESGPYFTSYSFTIGQPGQFGSVFDIARYLPYGEVNGGGVPTVGRFWLLTTAGTTQFGADPAPEPSTSAMLFAGIVLATRLVPSSSRGWRA
jgi:hypothetical protein